MATGTFVVCLLTLSGCLAFFEDKIKDKRDVPEMESVEWTSLKRAYDISSQAINGFSWKSCATSPTDINVIDIKLSPDPLKIPGDISLSMKFNVSKKVMSPLKTSITMKTRGFKIPCVNQMGSCEYQDFCQEIAPLANYCPDDWKKTGFTCACPVTPKVYNLTPLSFSIGVPVPQGQYEITVNMEQAGRTVMCIVMTVDIEKA